MRLDDRAEQEQAEHVHDQVARPRVYERERHEPPHLSVMKHLIRRELPPSCEWPRPRVPFAGWGGFRPVFVEPDLRVVVVGRLQPSQEVVGEVQADVEHDQPGRDGPEREGAEAAARAVADVVAVVDPHAWIVMDRAV
jgi:hypothetical protein